MISISINRYHSIIARSVSRNPFLSLFFINSSILIYRLELSPRSILGLFFLRSFLEANSFRSIFCFEIGVKKIKSFHSEKKEKKKKTIKGKLAIAPLRRSITSRKVVDRWLLARWRPSECLNTKIDIRGKLPGSIALSSAVTWSAISDKLTGKHGIDFSTAKLGFCGVSPPTLNRLPFGIPRARIGKGSKARSVINRCKRDRRQKRERETNHPAD